jgi:DNA ligase (NAD+)
MDKNQRMQELIEKLNEASKAYYGSGKEIMSNFEWDRLYDELVQLEGETGIVMANSPTVNVGELNAVLSGFEKVRHEISVKSLDKTKDVDTLAAFIGGCPGIMSWKLDGLTIVLTYDNGELVKAVTRGKNGIGELITANARHFAGVPSVIPYKGRLNVRGEALISYADFEKVNASLPEGEEPYKNPRNLAAGSVRQLDSAEVKNRKVQLIVFASDHMEDTHAKEFMWLQNMGFNVVSHIVVKDGSQVPVSVETFRSFMSDNPVPTDGLVLQFNETEYGRSLGETDKFPRDAIAFKWQDEEKETVVKEIFWSPARTGQITPVAVFEPVELEGTTVERASVHNVGILEQLSITPGDTITVYKANMIIPQVSGNNTMLGKAVIPETCPACGGRTEIRIGRDGSRQLYCTNQECSAKHVGRFVHAVKQDALNIVGMSEKTLEDLIDNGYLHTLADLFRLKEHAYPISQMEGYGRKSVDNMLNAVEAARHTDLQRLIYACGINLVGRTASRAICAYFGYDVVKTLNASFDELKSIEGIGDEIAGSYVEWFQNPANQEMFEDLLSEADLIVPQAPAVKEVAEGKPGIRGRVIVITGDVYQFDNRSAFKAWVEAHGGKVTGSVSRNTDYLVTNTPNSGTTKNKKAQELGVEIITEQQIIDMVE